MPKCRPYNLILRATAPFFSRDGPVFGRHLASLSLVHQLDFPKRQMLSNPGLICIFLIQLNGAIRVEMLWRFILAEHLDPFSCSEGRFDDACLWRGFSVRGGWGWRTAFVQCFPTWKTLGPGKKKEKILFQILAEKKSGSHVPRRRKCPSPNLAPFIASSKNCSAFLDGWCSLSFWLGFIFNETQDSTGHLAAFTHLRNVAVDDRRSQKQTEIPRRFVSEHVADDSFLAA